LKHHKTIATSQYRNCNFTKITIEPSQFVTENVEKVPEKASGGEVDDDAGV
jgi:hypothetical protein